MFVFNALIRVQMHAEAIVAGARQDRACAAINLNSRTLQRWQVDPSRGDSRPRREQAPANKLGVPEREHLLSVVNSAEFGSLPPSQIVPILADRGQYIASESTIYRVLSAYSTHIRPPSPRTFGHLVHGDPATDSMSIRPPIPR